MSLVRNIGIINKVPTAVLSMQYSEHDIARKLWAAEFGWGKTPPRKQPFIMESRMNQEEMNAVAMLQKIGFENPIQRKEDYKRMMQEAPVWIEHDFMLTMDEAVSKMERLKKENNVSMIVLDGLDWIVTNPHTYAEQKHSMQKLVQTAERLQIAVVLTQELNRNVENRVGNWPSLSDLRDGYYYLPAMGGSFSIKSVLPALFPNDQDLDYHNLSGTVHNGSEAMKLFPKIVNMSLNEQTIARESLLQYCNLDTWAMVKVWEKLKSCVN